MTNKDADPLTVTAVQSGDTENKVRMTITFVTESSCVHSLIISLDVVVSEGPASSLACAHYVCTCN